MPFAAPLGSTAFYGPSLANLSRSTQEISASTARLSSGNRLINAGDDVAALSIASRLQSQVVGIKAAQTNTTQGNSFLQVAYGGLMQIRDLLDGMKALAVQANSAALTTSDRELLQQEFAALSAEVDRLAETTNFNGINLLDGTVSGENTATTVSTRATQAEASLTFTLLPGAGEKVVLNGATFVAAVLASTSSEFTIGGTIPATMTNLAEALNASTDARISQATYEGVGSSLTIVHDSGGARGNQFIVDKAASTTAFTVSGASTQVADVYTLMDGEDDGLYASSVKASGSVGDAIVNTQSQVKASVTLTVSGTISNNETLSIDDGDGGVVAFTFKTTATPGGTEIQIGASTEETLQNAVEVLSQYAGTDNYGVRQLEFQVDGDQLIIRSKYTGNPTDLSGANLDISEGIGNASLSAAAFSNGTNTGVNVTGVNNGDFIGTIDGFTATYVGADSVTASVTVGSQTYTASITDTTPTGTASYRFTSAAGGYFDVELADGGFTVSDQPTANTYAARLNAAFSSLTFYQERNLSSFSGTGGLAGAEAKIQLGSFAGVQVKNITVTAPTTDDATIEIDVNGEIFRASSGIGGSLGAYETITLTSIQDGNKTIRLTGGASANSFDDAESAATFQAALRDSFGLNEEGTGLNFQVGTTAADKINVNIGDARTSKLFSGVTPVISDQDSAEDASDTLDAAILRVGQILADVGALQSRFDTAYNNLETTRINVAQARSSLADTDIAQESTDLAISILKANSATAVIAQTTRLQSALLDVLKVAA